jgi:hypothetical protein
MVRSWKKMKIDKINDYLNEKGKLPKGYIHYTKEFHCNKCMKCIKFIELNDLEKEELEKLGSFVCSDCINKEMRNEPAHEN